MKKELTVDFCCPSLNRVSELKRLIDSLYMQTATVSFQCVLRHVPHSIYEAYNAMIQYSNHDIVIAGSDSIQPTINCIQKLKEAFKKHFPQGDGVIGLNVVDLPDHPVDNQYKYLAIGRKFLERFGGTCGPFCPDYFHFFGTTELGMFANKLGKFHFAEDVKLDLFSPLNNTTWIDSTHKDGRSKLREDRLMWKRRQEHGLLWGESFERV